MPDLLEEAKRLSEAATPGPWLIETDRSDQYYDMPGTDDCEFNWRIVPEVLPPGANGVVNLIEEETSEADAEFIARARTLIPELVERVEQAEKERNGFAEAIVGIETRAQRAERAVIEYEARLGIPPFASIVDREALAAQQRGVEGG